MRKRSRRSPRARLLVMLAALVSLIVGYYLGQSWRRQPLDDLSVILFAEPRAIDYGDLAITAPQDTPHPWRLFVAGDTRESACGDMLRHYARVMNRLAARAGIQQRLRVTLLAYDNPDAAAATAFRSGVTWADVIGAPSAQLDRLGTQLGIGPDREHVCADGHTDASLVSPAHEAWALIPNDAPAIMAANIVAIVESVE